MKKYFFILMMLIVTKSYSQIPAPGSYQANNQLDKFVGTWQYVSGNDTFRIFLQKQKISTGAPLNYELDIIVGWHKYIKNGVLVETFMQHVGKPYNTNLSTIAGNTRNKNYRLELSFYDITKKKPGNSVVTFLPNSTTQVQWKLRNVGVRGVNNVQGFTVPTNVTLTKLNITPPNGSFGK